MIIRGSFVFPTCLKILTLNTEMLQAQALGLFSCPSLSLRGPLTHLSQSRDYKYHLCDGIYSHGIQRWYPKLVSPTLTLLPSSKFLLKSSFEHISNTAYSDMVTWCHPFLQKCPFNNLPHLISPLSSSRSLLHFQVLRKPFPDNYI